MDKKLAVAGNDYAEVYDWLWYVTTRCTTEEFIFYLELVFGSVRKHAGFSIITIEQRDNLAGILLEASYTATNLMPESYDRDQMEVAFEAAQSIVQLWALPRDKRDINRTNTVWEWFCIAGMFQADLKNSRLAKEIAERRQQTGDTRPFRFHPHGVIPTGRAQIIPFPQANGPRHDR